MAQDDLARGMARADLCRFLAACYYEPGPEFAEEKLFDSMHGRGVARATRTSRPARAGWARRSRPRTRRRCSSTTRACSSVRWTRSPSPTARSGCAGTTALMQDSTMAVQQLYAEGGFEIDDGFRELPDHVAAELEFLYLLIFRETEAQRQGGPRRAGGRDRSAPALSRRAPGRLDRSLHGGGQKRRADRFLPRARRPRASAASAWRPRNPAPADRSQPGSVRHVTIRDPRHVSDRANRYASDPDLRGSRWIPEASSETTAGSPTLT